MKQVFGWLLLLVAMMIVFMWASPVSAQDVNNDRISITFHGDRATVTLKDATANYAIGELVDNVRKQDFKNLDGELYYPVYVGNADGMRAIWWISSDNELYYVGFCDGPAIEEGESTFENLTDAKRELKKAMRYYYSVHRTLDAQLSASW